MFLQVSFPFCMGMLNVLISSLKCSITEKQAPWSSLTMQILYAPQHANAIPQNIEFHKRLFHTSVVNLQNIITIAAMCCTAVNRPFTNLTVIAREYSRSNYHYAAIQYSTIYKQWAVPVVVGPFRVGCIIKLSWGNKVVLISCSLEGKRLHTQEENNWRGKENIHGS